MSPLDGSVNIGLQNVIREQLSYPLWNMQCYVIFNLNTRIMKLRGKRSTSK